MIVNLTMALLSTIMTSADPRIEERNAFPSPETTYVKLREIDRSFLLAERDCDNWAAFVPILSKAVEYQSVASDGMVKSVESVIVSHFTLYSFACEYDEDLVKANFDSRLKCVGLLSQFALVRSDTNTLFKLADWLGGAIPLAADKATEFAEMAEAHRRDKQAVYGGKNPPRYPGDSGNTRRRGPAARRRSEKFCFRRLYNERLPSFRETALEFFRPAVLDGYKELPREDRKMIWTEFCRRAKATGRDTSTQPGAILEPNGNASGVLMSCSEVTLPD